MKMRTYGLTAEWLDGIGAKTTYIPAAEVYVAFTTGIIDAWSVGGCQ